MTGLTLGAVVSGMVVMVVLVVASVTAAYCRWVERSDNEGRRP